MDKVLKKKLLGEKKKIKRKLAQNSRLPLPLDTDILKITKAMLQFSVLILTKREFKSQNFLLLGTHIVMQEIRRKAESKRKLKVDLCQ